MTKRESKAQKTIQQREEQLAIKNVIIEAFEHQTLSDPFKSPKHRLRELSDNRAVLMYLLRKMTRLSYQEIGSLWKTSTYKGKNHATVMHHCRRIDDLLDSGDKHITYLYTSCRREINKTIPVIDLSPQKTLSEDLIETKKLNRKLIHREIQRKNDLELLKKGLRYIPLKHKKRIKHYLDTCQIPL